MSNKLINDFENFLKETDTRKALSVIGITHLFDNNDITLLLKDKQDGIGGHFVVFPTRNPLPVEEYDDSLCYKPPDEVLKPPKYDICEFVEFMDWCFNQGWTVRLELFDCFDFKEKRKVGRFTVEAQERKARYV